MSKQLIRLESLVIALLCFLFSVVRGPAIHPTKQPKSIAVINLTNNIGDMVCTTPLLGALKKKFPTARILVVGRPKNGELFAGHPHVDAYIEYRSFFLALSMLKKEEPTLAVTLNQNLNESGLAYLAGAKQVSTFSHPTQAGSTFRFLKHLFSIVTYHPGRYLPEEYLTLLSPLGVTNAEAPLALGVSKEVTSFVKQDLERKGLQPGKFAVIMPGAGQPFRMWPTQHFSTLISRMWKEHNIPIAVAGGFDDIPLFEELNRRVVDIPLYNAVGQSIEELKVLLSFARVVISNDSGGAQIARAFGVPTIVIVGVSDAKEHHRNTQCDRIIQAELPEGSLLAQSIVTNYSTFNTRTAREIMNKITPEQVFQEFNEIMHRCVR